MDILAEYKRIYPDFELPAPDKTVERNSENYFATRDNGKRIFIDTDKSCRYGVMGTAGSGKSNTLSVVFSKYWEDGHKLMIFDVSGEYHNIRKKSPRKDCSFSMDDTTVLVAPFIVSEYRGVLKETGGIEFKLLSSELEPNDYVKLLGYTDQIVTKSTLQRIIRERRPEHFSEMKDLIDKYASGITRSSLLNRYYELEALGILDDSNGWSLEELIKDDTPMVFDFRGCSMAEDARTDFMQAFIDILLRKQFTMKRGGEIHRKRILNVFDEVQNLLSPGSLCKTRLGQLLAEGRKYKLDTIFATQFPLKIPQDFYQNFSDFIFHKMPSRAALNYVEESLRAWGVGFSDELLTFSDPGQAIYFNLNNGEPPQRVRIPYSPVGKGA